MSDPKPLTRNELARLFNNDSRAIKAFEQLFDAAPSDLTELEQQIIDNQLELGLTYSQVNNIISQISKLKDDTEEEVNSIRLTAELSLSKSNQAELPFIDYFGMFTKTSDQTAAVINTAYPLTFDNEVNNKGIIIDSGTASRITINNRGKYLISAEVQYLDENNTTKNIYTWFRKNGTDISNSSSVITVATDGVSSFSHTVSKSLIIDVNNGDYIELVFATDNINMRIDTIAATAFSPVVASAIMTIKRLKE